MSHMQRVQCHKLPGDGVNVKEVAALATTNAPTWRNIVYTLKYSLTWPMHFLLPTTTMFSRNKQVNKEQYYYSS